MGGILASATLGDGALSGPRRRCGLGWHLGRASQNGKHVRAGNSLRAQEPRVGLGDGRGLGVWCAKLWRSRWTTSNGRGKGSACASKVEKHRV